MMLSAGVVGALELGHSRVTSAPGKPLVVLVTLKSIAQGDTVSVSLASAPAWQASGLKLPVALDSMSVKLLPSNKPDSRVVEIRSSQASNLSVIDMLLSVKTDSADRLLQTSVIVPSPPKVRLAGETVTVQRGDTLIGIAEQFPVAGADLYQQLWALYSANPKAFFEENMNLLKAGASLRIPDADTVRAIDPRFAKAQYLAHVRAFRQRTSGGQGNQGISGTAVPETLKAPEVQQGNVQAPSQAEPVAPVTDQVRLSSVAGVNATPGSAQAQAAAQAVAQDQQTSEAKARAEEISRKEALEQNVKALQGALAAGGTSAHRSDVASPSGTEQIGTAGGPVAGSTGGSTGGSTSTQPGTSTGSATGDLAGATAGVASQTGQSVSSAASTDRGSSDSGASAGSRGNTSGSKSSQSASSTTSGSTTDAGGVWSNLSKDPIAKLGAWVGDNTMAAIAILLALIALILAWALRSSKNSPAAVSGSAVAVAAPAAAFEKQLKEIDLSLDEPDVSGAKSASEPKPNDKV